jgi:nucleoside-diphosphate-sugar epimerase
MTRSVFLTGATGYVGSHVLAELARRGHKLVCLARSTKAAQRLESEGHAIQLGDLSGPTDWMKAATKSDTILHTAFPYGDDGQELDSVEARFVRDLLCAMREQQRQPRLIYTSSLFLFGAKRNCAPFSENDAPPLDRAAWRLGVETEVLSEAPSNAVIRLGWVYGGDGGTLDQASASVDLDAYAELRVPLIHVEDAAKLYALAIEQRWVGPFHACEPVSLRWRDVASMVRPHCQPKPRTLPDNASGLFDHDRPARPLRSIECGWKPTRQFARDYKQTQ